MKFDKSMLRLYAVTDRKWTGKKSLYVQCEETMEAGDVRAALGRDRILGVTAKTVEQAIRAQERGADYLGVGAVFGSSTKRDAISISISQLIQICSAVTIPVVAIGGITRENIRFLAGSGAAGVAVVSGIFSNEDIGLAVRQLKSEVKEMLEGYQ